MILLIKNVPFYLTPVYNQESCASVVTVASKPAMHFQCKGTPEEVKGHQQLMIFILT